MFIKEVQNIIRAFHERYVEKCDSERTDYYRMIADSDENGITYVEFFIMDYSLIAWFDDSDVFHIENGQTHESILNYADEQGWDEETVNYIRYGSFTGYGKTIHEDGTFTNNAYGKKVVPTSDCMSIPDGPAHKIIRASQIYIGDGMYVYAGQLGNERYFVSSVFDLEHIDAPDCIEYVDLCSKNPYIEDYDIDLDICSESHIARYTGDKADNLIRNVKKILKKLNTREE